MKNKLFTFLLLTCCLSGCGQSNVTSQDIANNQTVEISVDNKKYNISTDDIFSSSYVGQTHLVFAVLSEKNDITFKFSAFMSDLKPGTFQVWDCKSASTCTQEEDDKNQNSIFGPYPKIPMVPVNLSRTAYNAPKLGLKPLTLIISSVTDEQQVGNLKTKRIKGQFNGILAYVERQQDRSWKIIGKTTNIEGKFDMFCNIR